MAQKKEPKSIWMDVGCWQSGEKGEPTMTFGLLEHNAIALCTYYSNGKLEKRTPINKIGGASYDYSKSLIHKFLELMMIGKYKDYNSFKKIDYERFHIVKIITFDDKTLLDTKDALLLFIPDIHLHYFKESYLDNFITHYENNTWAKERPKAIRCKRKSMEEDFGKFINTISVYKGKEKGSLFTFFLGDVVELWEMNAILTFYNLLNKKAPIRTIREQLQSIIKGEKQKKSRDKEIDEFNEELYELIMDLIKIVKNFTKSNNGGKTETLYNFLGEVENAKISKMATDSIFYKQILTLLGDPKLIEDLMIDRNCSGDKIKEKAIRMQYEILKKYKSNDRHDLNDFFLNNLLSCWKLIGNHDNFLMFNDFTPALTFAFGEVEIDPSSLTPLVKNQKSDIFINHGQDLDSVPANINTGCGIGYLITSILTLFEIKKRGELLKEFEGRFVGPNWRESNIKNILSIFSQWKSSDNTWQKDGRFAPELRSNVIITAHTHQPALIDISGDYKAAALFSDFDIKREREREKLYPSLPLMDQVKIFRTAFLNTKIEYDLKIDWIKLMKERLEK